MTGLICQHPELIVAVAMAVLEQECQARVTATRCNSREPEKYDYAMMQQGATYKSHNTSTRQQIV